jgi:signal transduction histidine kinase
MSEYIKVLLIEDNPADSDLIEDILSGVEDQVFEFVTAGRLSVALELLADRGIDIILCDLSLPDSHGLETFLAVRDKARNQPIIVLSGLSDETVALKAVRQGAQDYLVKGRVGSNLLVRSIRYAIERNRMLVELDGFAHTVSHDLKGPLTSIRIASETLERVLENPEDARDKVTELLRIMTSNVDKSSRLIADLLILAESGQRPTELQDVYILDTVQTVLADLGGELSKKGVAVELGEDLGTVRANPTHIYQVFLNLIANAIKHNDSERPLIVVSCGGRDKHGRNLYRVRDNGSGIAADVIGTIFVPFIKGEAGGTGIGLSIVEKIVKLYGGWIRAANDEGACFDFALADYPE